MAKRAFLIAGPASQAPAPGGSRTLTEHTYERLRDDILEGRLGPDEKLRVEHLKARYAVGAGTLREAITRLVSDALVVAEGQRGFRVAPMATADLEDLTQLRLHIEIDALRRSIRQGDEAWRARVRQAFDDLCTFEQPVPAAQRASWEQRNTRFHEALISACDSPWTSKVLQLLSRHSERYRRFSLGVVDGGRDVQAEHRQIFEMAMSGQEARAALALEAHVRATADLLARTFSTRAASHT